MPTHLRLLKGATALLYIGPLFAGISGLGFGILAPFVAIFVTWLLILRPEQWPATAEEWLVPQAIGAVVTQILSQILLVCILLGIGRGVGAVAGFLPVVNPIFPLAVSFLAIPLCRLLWDARAAADQGIFLDDEAERAETPRVLAEAAAAIVPLLNLPDDARDQQVNDAVARVMDVSTAGIRLDAISAALSRPDRSHAALRRALILWLSEPETVATGRVGGGMAEAFCIAAGNGDLLRLYVPRALALVAAFPDRAEDFPAPVQLRQAALDDAKTDPSADLPVHLRADLAEGLTALARAVEQTLAAAVLPGQPADPVVQQSARVA